MKTGRIIRRAGYKGLAATAKAVSGKVMQESANQDISHSAAAGKKTGLPWFVRVLLALGAVFGLLLRYMWRLARKNLPLAVGLALFAGVFTATAYNALWRQSRVSRPILFSTRVDKTAWQRPGGGGPGRPFVAKAIGTGARANSAKTAAAAPGRQQSPRDAIADVIAAQVKGALAGAARPK